MLKPPYGFLLKFTSIVFILLAYGFSFLLAMQSDNRYQWMKMEDVTHLPADADSPERVRMFVLLIVFLVFVSATINFIKDKSSYFTNRLFWLSVMPLLYAIWRYFRFLID